MAKVQLRKCGGSEVLVDGDIDGGDGWRYEIRHVMNPLLPTLRGGLPWQGPTAGETSAARTVDVLTADDRLTHASDRAIAGCRSGHRRLDGAPYAVKLGGSPNERGLGIGDGVTGDKGAAGVRVDHRVGEVPAMCELASGGNA